MGENLRTIQLYFYVTEKENEIIKERMKESGVINLSHYLRKMAISGNIIHLDMTDIRAVSRLLSSCSNNLNQYVRPAHETGNIYATDIEDLNERLNEVTKQFKAILQGFVKLMSMVDLGMTVFFTTSFQVTKAGERCPSLSGYFFCIMPI